MIRYCAGRCPTGRAAAAVAVEPISVVSSKADIPNAEEEPKRLTAADLRPALRWAFNANSALHIQNEVAQFYGIQADQLRAPDRKGLREPRIVHPRQMAMLLCREVAGMSYSQIGRRFERDHSTVMHGIKAVEKRCKTDPYVEIELEVLRERFAA